MTCLPALKSSHTLFVAHTATAELLVFKVLGSPFPRYVLDLNVEMRNLTNGILPRTFLALPDCAKLLHVPFMNKAQKDAMRAVAIRGAPFTTDEQRALVDYCAEDTMVLIPICQALAPKIALAYALIRGDYVKASAEIDYRGLPVNMPAYQLITEHRLLLPEEIDDLDKVSFAIGPDGRNRYMSGLFGTVRCIGTVHARVQCM